jgi:uncharacterized membrane protein YhaH (DUF805 family)
VVWSIGVGVVSTLVSMALVFAFVPQVLGGWAADAKFWSVWSLGQLPAWAATTSLMARRLHDLGKSAVWLIPMYAYFSALIFVWPGINNMWMAFVLILPMFIVVPWLIGAPGDKHDNRFGAVTTID